MNVVQKGAWQGRLQLTAVALTVCDLVIVLLAYFGPERSMVRSHLDCHLHYHPASGRPVACQE
jgi:hypothetical protein